MLGIPIHSGPFRRGQDDTTLDDATDSRFVNLGHEIVNLALKGFMDSATIQAFFHVYGYSVEQRFGDPTRAAVLVHAIGMNLEKLVRTLRRRRMVEQTKSAMDVDKRFADGDMRSLMDRTLTEEEAWRALVMGKGKVKKAMDWWTKWEPWGQLPSPAGALSPPQPVWRRLLGQLPPPGYAMQSRAPHPRVES